MAKRNDKLVVVESPKKAKTIGKYLGAGYKVMASVGHIRDLPERELGVDVDNDFEPKYVTIRGKGKIIQELRKEAENVGEVLLATDPDREGEAIAWHVMEELKRPKLPISRSRSTMSRSATDCTRPAESPNASCFHTSAETS